MLTVKEEMADGLPHLLIRPGHQNPYYRPRILLNVKIEWADNVKEKERINKENIFTTTWEYWKHQQDMEREV